jgi:VWFA-related protein
VILRRLTLSFLALTVLASAPGALAAGDGDEGAVEPIGGLTFKDEFEVTVANIIVYVSDKKGEPVTDLGADDFVVEQDGERREISNFQLYTEDLIRQQLAGEALPPVAGPTPVPEAEDEEGLPEPMPVYLVLYIDNENLRPLDRNRVLSQARNFVIENLHPPAQMMVVSRRRSVKVLQPFTADPDRVLSAMRSTRMDTGGRSERDSAKREILDKIKSFRDEQQSSRGYSNYDTGQRREVYKLIYGYAKEEANNLLFTMDGLRQVINNLSGLPGKKGIIYVSSGLPMIPGMDLFYEVNRVYQDFTLLTELSNYDRSRLYQQLAATANAQQVTLYTISATGLDMQGMGSAEHRMSQDPLSASIGSHNYTDSLVFMADETGGVAIVNTNDISLGLERVTHDMFTYYSVGYPVQSSGKDKVHKIKVSLPDHPEYTVRYRPRFVEKSIETRVQDAVMSGLEFDIDDNPMQVEVETGEPAPAAEGRWLLPTHISFPLRKVALMPEGEDYVGRVTLFVAVRGRDGKTSDIVRQQHEVRVPAADYEEAQRQRFGIDTQLLMEAGRYRVGIAILDQITRQDSYAAHQVAVHPDES